MSVPGDYWPWFAIMALIAVVPLALVGPSWKRILGAACFLVSVVLIVMNLRAGKAYEQRHHQLHTQKLDQTFETRTGVFSETFEFTT